MPAESHDSAAQRWRRIHGLLEQVRTLARVNAQLDAMQQRGAMKLVEAVHCETMINRVAVDVQRAVSQMQCEILRIELERKQKKGKAS